MSMRHFAFFSNQLIRALYLMECVKNIQWIRLITPSNFAQCNRLRLESSVNCFDSYEKGSSWGHRRIQDLHSYQISRRRNLEVCWQCWNMEHSFGVESRVGGVRLVNFHFNNNNEREKKKASPTPHTPKLWHDTHSKNNSFDWHSVKTSHKRNTKSLSYFQSKI